MSGRGWFVTSHDPGSASRTQCGVPIGRRPGAVESAKATDTALLDQLRLMPTWSNYVSLVAPQVRADAGSTGETGLLVAGLRGE